MGENTADVTLTLDRPQDAVFLFCARDANANEDRGHQSRWAIQRSEQHSFALALNVDFEKYSWPGPRHTIPYGRHAAYLQGGPLGDRKTGYYVENLTNVDAQTAVNRMKEAAIYFSFGHGGDLVGWGIHRFYATFWQYAQSGPAPAPLDYLQQDYGSWSYWVAKAGGRDQLVAGGVPANRIIVLDQLPAGTFNKMKLAVLAGCKTAAASADTNSPWGSPTHTIVARGAETAVGFRETIYGHSGRILRRRMIGGEVRFEVVELPIRRTPGAQEWCAVFWDLACRNGDSVVKAVSRAAREIPRGQNLGTYRIAGNEGLTLAPAGHRKPPN